MRKRQTSTILAALLAVGAGALVAAPGAQALDRPEATLQLAVVPADTESAPQQVTLDCAPNGGTHPAADSSCASLDQVDGRFADLPTRDGICTMEHRPVTVRATGEWRGEPVSYEEEFGNTCAAEMATDGVFGF
jgi:hypothetical protein